MSEVTLQPDLSPARLAEWLRMVTWTRPGGPEPELDAILHILQSVAPTQPAPSVNTDLVEALRGIAVQHLSAEMVEKGGFASREEADFELAYDMMIERARAALSRAEAQPAPVHEYIAKPDDFEYSDPADAAALIRTQGWPGPKYQAERDAYLAKRRAEAQPAVVSHETPADEPQAGLSVVDERQAEAHVVERLRLDAALIYDCQPRIHTLPISERQKLVVEAADLIERLQADLARWRQTAIENATGLVVRERRIAELEAGDG